MKLMNIRKFKVKPANGDWFRVATSVYQCHLNIFGIFAIVSYKKEL